MAKLTTAGTGSATLKLAAIITKSVNREWAGVAGDLLDKVALITRDLDQDVPQSNAQHSSDMTLPASTDSLK